MPRHGKLFGIYFHIPFCRKRCRYCDYVTYEKRENDIPAYLMSLCKETAKRSTLVDKPVGSIYIGGGTPSLLGPAGLEFLTVCCRENFVLDPKVEWTLEVNPDSITPELLKTALKSGINRLSLGVQTLNDNLLTLIGRTHSAKQCREAFLMASGMNFSNISVDLLYGLPAQTPDDFCSGLEEVVEWGAQHLTIYALTVVPGSELYKQYKEGILPLAPEGLVAEMYGQARSLLIDNEYDHYEISNFARPDFASVHNLNYWNHGPYLGLGVGAESYIGSTRTRNTDDLSRYMDLLRSEEPLDRIIQEREEVPAGSAAGDAIISGLRTGKGINIDEYNRRFETSILKRYDTPIKTLCRAGLLEIDHGYLRLSDRGFMLSHLVFKEFL